MIAKVTIGKSFGGTIRYLFEGHKDEDVDKGARLLDYSGVRPDKEKMIIDFNRHRTLNPDLGNAVMHFSFSYDYSDRVADKEMVKHVRRFLVKLGIDPDSTQWALIRHHDRDHDHGHLALNRIDFNGKTIRDNLIAVKAKKCATQVAQEFGLTIAENKPKNLKKTNKNRLPVNDQVRYEIYEILQKEIATVTSVAQLTKILQDQGIELQQSKKGDGKGISFAKGKHKFKASQIDRKFTGSKIHKQIEENQTLFEKNKKENEIPKEEFLLFAQTMTKIMNMPSLELRDLFKKGRNKELTKVEILVINKLITSDPEVKKEFNSFVDDERNERINNRINEFYLVIAKSDYGVEADNAQRFIKSARTNNNLGLISTFLAKDFAKPADIAGIIETRLENDYFKNKSVYLPEDFRKEWMKRPNNERFINFKKTEDSEEWRNTINSHTLTPTQQQVVESLNKMRPGNSSDDAPSKDKKQQQKY